MTWQIILNKEMCPWRIVGRSLCAHGCMMNGKFQDCTEENCPLRVEGTVVFKHEKGEPTVRL